MKPINTIMRYIKVRPLSMNYCKIMLTSILFFCILFPSNVEGSIIVAFRTSKQLVIGADSLGISDSGDRKFQICKIIQIGNTILAFTGRPIMPYFKFNAFTLAEDVFKRKEAITSSLDLYDALIKRHLTEIVGIVKENRQFTNNWYKATNGQVLSIRVSDITNPYPVAYIRIYKVISENPVIIQSIPANLTYELSDTYIDDIITEKADEISKERNKVILSGDPTKFDPIKAINDWITLEIKTYPNFAGFPVDILRITPGKAEWIQHKPECPEIK